MRQDAVDSADEIKRLQRCMSDLVSVLALPAAWSNSEPSRILETFLDALVTLLELDFLFARARLASQEEPIELLTIAETNDVGDGQHEILQALHQWLDEATPDNLPALRRYLGNREISILPLQLGANLGFIVAGCQRSDFPHQTERLVMTVAANQLAVMLQQAQLLGEQKRVARELDERVAQRTAEGKRAQDELQRSEERHRVVVETANDAVISMDESSFIILANAATKRIFGYEAAELIGKPLAMLMPEAMRKLHGAGFKRYLNTGERRLNWQGTELTALRADGEHFPVEISFGEVTTDGRKIFTGFIRDISEKKRAEEALDKARSELTKVARVSSLGVLTASIAHEVNQPLSGIITNAGTCLRMLSADPPNVEGARETARRTIRDGNRAADVITRLRSLYSRKEPSPEPMDLNEAAREVIALLLTELQSSGVILRQEFADNLPVFKADRIQLQQVILNLLRNASDAMGSVENWPKRLVITTEYDSEHVRLMVEDAGIGFDPAIADRIFESFYTTKQEGMGIGLSVSRSIIEAHGGRLWATANDGPGATFAFSIPCQHSE